MHTLSKPAIYAPARLWTGKQVFSILLRPNKNSDEIVNLNAKAKRFKMPKNADGEWNWNGKNLIGFSQESPEFIPDDSWVVIRNSNLLSG